MAGITKVNPTATKVPHANIGKPVQLFTIDYINAINGSAGPLGAQKAVLDTIMNTATIIMAGPLGNSNTEQTYMVRRDSLDTISSTTTVAAIQAAIRALDGLTPDKVTATISSATAGDRDMSDTQVA